MRIKLVLLAVLSLFFVELKAQVTDTILPSYLRTNPFSKKYSFQINSLYKQQWDYIPGVGFVIRTKFDNDSLFFGKPKIEDFDSFLQQQNQSSFYKLWHERMLSSRTGNNNFMTNFLSPNIKLGIKGMNQIFGSDVVSIRPTGSIGLTFGLAYNKVYNPALPPDLRGRYPTFVFNQDIQLGVNGKIGNKLNVGINYNTNSMFDFQDKKKIEYTGDEDEILQRLEAGNVMFTTQNPLIQGSSTLFGIKSVMKFGRLTVEAVVSHRKGQAKTIEVSGGAVVTDFKIRASDYEADQHFFLCHYFRQLYEKSLRNLPAVTSPIKITKVEVWVTNRTSDFNNARNIVAFQDLGETQGHIYDKNFVHANPSITYASNQANDLYQKITKNYPGVRNIAKSSAILTSLGMTEGVDFVKLESARKLDPKDYTVNRALGYISLNYPLRPGEILAVAFEYTMNGKVYKVGEFSEDVKSPDALVVKLLRGPADNPHVPMWDLMMKNIYALGSWNISPDDFQLDIYYDDDRTGNMIDYLPEGKIKKVPLLRVFNFDRADQQLNPFPDGFFDFIKGVTIDPEKGLIIFPELEPFGSFLRKKIGDSVIANHYVYQELYDSTQYIAKQMAVKNKFYIEGHYKSSSGSEIMLNAMNIPPGSVKVTQGGRVLKENVDYTVDYNIGKVTIINKSVLMSGIPIKISLESQDLYGLTTQNFMGTNFNYTFSKNFNVGMTFLHLTELPVEIKTPFGSEPVSNTMWGLNTSYSTQLPLLTKIIDHLPFVSTKAPSRLDVNANFAQLIPGNPRARNIRAKQGVSYIDDFENCQSYIDLKAPQSWVLASIPHHQPDKFPEATDVTGRTSGYNRALLAWYDVSPDFTYKNSQTRPSYMTLDDISNDYVREVLETEIYPNRQPFYNTPARLTVLNLAFYPSERGPYNFDVQGKPGISAGIDANGNLKDPQTRWGGIMRALYITDFESANIEFIEFWLMDPFEYDSTSTGGNLYIDLGDISEDILQDGRKSFENGIPYPDDPTKVDTTQWGIVSKEQMTSPNFSNDPAARKRQDAGFDGILDKEEDKFYAKYLQKIAALFGTNSKAYQTAVKDPSNDDFKYFLDPSYDKVHASILDRYKHYNGTEGNSPIAKNGQNTYQAVSFQPDMEDINHDNTLDNYEAYYEYKIHLSPQDMKIGKNFIVNKVRANVKLPNGKYSHVTWYQFKIPIRQPTAVYGDISGFKSIRFMRIYLRGWRKPVILRFAELNLVRDEWRPYEGNLLEGQEASTVPQPQDNSTFDISVVNIEESSQKEPVNYILPPGVTREQDPYNTQLRQLNEQSLSMKVTNLADGQAKAIYKLVDMDLRRYKRLKMFIHAEALEGEADKLHDDDVCLFIRLGSDFTQNYYEYEIPLKVTPPGHYYSPDNDVDNPQRYIVWPKENNLDLALQTLLDVKERRNELMHKPGSNVSYSTPFVVYQGDRKITVLGNPNLSNIKVIMIGIRNRSARNNPLPDDGQPKSCEVWIDELRLEDFNNDGGWAASGTVNLTLADVGNVNFAAYMHTPGFGSLEQRVNQRYKDQLVQYNLSTRLQLGRFLPRFLGASIPFYWGYSESISTPEYNPLDPDIKLRVALSNPNLSPADREKIKLLSQTYVRRQSFNITNLHFAPQFKTKKKSRREKSKRHRRGYRHSMPMRMPWDIRNFATSFAYNEVYQHSPTVEFNVRQNLMLALNYNYNPNPRPVYPFSRIKLFNHRFFRLIHDFNFYYLPNRVSVSGEIDRQFVSYRARNLVQNLDISLPVMTQKNFLWRRNYDLSYRLSRSMRLDFTAHSEARVYPQGWRDFTGNSWYDRVYNPKDTIFMRLYDPGQNTVYTHNLRINWQTPINKLPLLGWTSLNLSYNATYDWRRGQEPIRVPATDTTPAYVINFGNMIQNSSVFQANLQLNFMMLYNSIPFLRNVNSRFTPQGYRPPRSKRKDVVYRTHIKKLWAHHTIQIHHNLGTKNIQSVIVLDSTKRRVVVNYHVLDKNTISLTPAENVSKATVVVNGYVVEKISPFRIALDYFLKTLMFMQNVSVSYRTNAGTMLNGFMPQANIMGMSKINQIWAPGWRFIAGLQDPNYVDYAASQGWLTTDTLFNKPIVTNSAQEFRARISLAPLNNVRIDLNFDRSMSYQKTEYGYALPDGEFNRLSQVIQGNFYISTNTIRTAFERYDPLRFHSAAYDRFLQDRYIIAQRLARQRKLIEPSYDDTPVYDSLTGRYYPRGYSFYSQQVLIPALLAAYTGISPEKVELRTFPLIPLPDWRISFDGLGNLPFIKKIVNKITLTNSYSSTFTVNNFQSNPNFDFDTYDRFGYSDATYPTTGDFIPLYEVAAVSLSERFVPLIGLNMQFKNKMSIRLDYKKTRDIFLSFSNNQIRERHSNSITFGGGYIIPNVRFMINTASGPMNIKSDLNIRLDLTYEHTYEIFRRIVENISQLNIERKNLVLSVTADYNINDKVSVELYYNHNVMETNTAPKTLNLEGGFRVRVALAP